MEIISEARYHYASKLLEGWCRHCQGFTRTYVSPDSSYQYCPACRRYEVFGHAKALMLGLICPEDAFEREGEVG